jgi:hypothetical protein
MNETKIKAESQFQIEQNKPAAGVICEAGA